jgi:DNA-binding NtrC family response regulator
LNVVHIALPALKNRKEDIKPLLDFYLTEFAKSYGKPEIKFSEAAYEKCANYSWPGNVRELQNAVSRAALMAEGTIIEADHMVLEETVEATPTGMPEWQKLSLGEIERYVILERLKEFKGNRTHSSRALGISIRTLRNKIREYKAMGIDVP